MSVLAPETPGLLTFFCIFTDKRVISAETFYHPMSKVWHCQDRGETTVMQGEWTTTHRGEPSHRRRRQLVHVVRYAAHTFTFITSHISGRGNRISAYCVCVFALSRLNRLVYGICYRDTEFVTGMHQDHILDKFEGQSPGSKFKVIRLRIVIFGFYCYLSDGIQTSGHGR